MIRIFSTTNTPISCVVVEPSNLFEENIMEDEIFVTV